jgi:hypothetical protein
MLFTMPALQQLGLLFFLPRCEVIHAVNDLFIGYCTSPANVTKVHCTSFYSGVTHLPRGVDIGMVVTTHRVKPRTLIMQFTCVVAARFGWPHPPCLPK